MFSVLVIGYIEINLIALPKISKDVVAVCDLEEYSSKRKGESSLCNAYSRGSLFVHYKASQQKTILQ